MCVRRTAGRCLANLTGSGRDAAVIGTVDGSRSSGVGDGAAVSDGSLPGGILCPKSREVCQGVAGWYANGACAG